MAAHGPAWALSGVANRAIPAVLGGSGGPRVVLLRRPYRRGVAGVVVPTRHPLASAGSVGEATMCADLDCDGQAPPPTGERWCLRRLDIELERVLSGYPMRCGVPALVCLAPAAERG